jgi:hypothetical protein
MIQICSSRRAGSAFNEAGPSPLHLRRLAMPALADRIDLAVLGSVSTVAVALISALAMATLGGV